MAHGIRLSNSMSSRGPVVFFDDWSSGSKPATHRYAARPSRLRNDDNAGAVPVNSGSSDERNEAALAEVPLPTFARTISEPRWLAC